MKENREIKLIVVNPPAKEHVQKKLKEVSNFLSKELSQRQKQKNHTLY